MGCGCEVRDHYVPLFPFGWHAFAFFVGLCGLVVSSLWVHISGMVLGGMGMIFSLAFAYADFHAEVKKIDTYQIERLLQDEDADDDESIPRPEIPEKEEASKKNCAEKITRGCALISQILLVLLVILLAFIHFMGKAKDPGRITSFPSNCPSTSCYRFAPGEQSYNEPITWETDIRTARTLVENVMRTEGTLIDDYWDFLHYRALTPFLGMPDDVFFELNRTSGIIYVWIQSQSRLGGNDFGENEIRVTSLVQELRSLSPEKKRSLSVTEGDVEQAN